MPTKEIFLPYYGKSFGKKHTFLENQCTKSLSFATMKAFGMNLTCCRKLEAFETPILKFYLKF